MNIEFALIPFLGWACVLMGGLVIVRQWRWQSRRCIQKAIGLVKAGAQVGVSIEGRRSLDGTAFKKGPIVLAIESEADILPMSFHGAAECMPYGSWQVRPGRVRVQVHESIQTKGANYNDRNRFLDQLLQVAAKAGVSGVSTRGREAGLVEIGEL